MSWKPVESKDYIKYKCPSCSNSITSILGDKALYVTCEKCDNFFHNNAGQLTYVAHFKKTAKPIFKVGTTGTYKDKKFQLIGFAEVKEDKTTYYWREYVIKYEDETIAYFMEYEGHWSYVEQLPTSITATKGGDIIYQEEKYTYFNSYKSVVVYATGSFLWNLVDGEKPRIQEYINPPYGLVCEKKKAHITWYKSEYIKASKIKTIFDVESNHWLPYRQGVYSIQPLPVPAKKSVLIELSLIYILVLTAALAAFSFMSDEKTVFDMRQELNQSPSISYTPTDSLQSKTVRTEILDRGIYYPDSNTFVSEPFKISSQFNSTALDVTLYAPVSNNWFEVSCQMINENTGQEYFFEEGVEYYFGSDWTEGSKDNRITLSEIPDGTYRIIIKPIAGAEGGMQVTDYRITIIEGVLLWSNFIILLILGLSIPIGMIIYINNFNASRWYNSNLSQ